MLKLMIHFHLGREVHNPPPPKISNHFQSPKNKNFEKQEDQEHVGRKDTTKKIPVAHPFPQILERKRLDQATNPIL